MEETPQVEGVLHDDHVIIKDENMIHELELKGYGEKSKTDFLLKPFESLYLLYTSKLTLFKSSKTVDFDSLIEICVKHDPLILTKFLIYRDLRNRGYVVKDGFGFGSDFIVYERGHFGEKGAKFLVFGMNEGYQEKIGTLQKQIEEITKMGKEPIIAVIERRGEVIYYKVSRMNFYENKATLESNFSA